VLLPLLIDPCPIVDATVELRFESAFPAAVAVGLAYQKLIQVFPRVSPVPNFPFPDAVRQLNPALLYQPQFRFESDDFVALLGPNIFAVGVNGPYTKWALVSKEFETALDLFKEANVIGTPQRFGLKYTNFFPENVFSKLNLTLAIAGTETSGQETFIKTVLPSAPFKIDLQILTDVKMNSTHPKLLIDPNVPGTMIALDCFKDALAMEDLGVLEKTKEVLDLAHTKEKELFFRLLKEEFLQTLNPRYE